MSPVKSCKRVTQFLIEIIQVLGPRILIGVDQHQQSCSLCCLPSASIPVLTCANGYSLAQKCGSYVAYHIRENGP